MTSSRLILIFLGFIFLIIVILSSARISSVLRERFAGFFPKIQPLTISETTPTPTPPSLSAETQTPTPTTFFRSGSTPSSEIPATGPENLVWLILVGSFFTGVSLKKISQTKV